MLLKYGWLTLVEVKRPTFLRSKPSRWSLLNSLLMIYFEVATILVLNYYFNSLCFRVKRPKVNSWMPENSQCAKVWTQIRFVTMLQSSLRNLVIDLILTFFFFKKKFVVACITGTFVVHESESWEMRVEHKSRQGALLTCILHSCTTKAPVVQAQFVDCHWWSVGILWTILPVYQDYVACPHNYMEHSLLKVCTLFKVVQRTTM